MSRFLFPLRSLWRLRHAACLGLAVLRPHLLVPAWVCCATGGALVGRAGDDGGFGPSPPPGIGNSGIPGLPPLGGPETAALAAWSAALAAIHLVNLAADRASDAANRKNLFWHDRLPPGQLIRCSHLVAVAAVLLAVGAGLVAGDVSAARPSALGSAAAVATVLTLVLGFCYSLPPVRLVARWGWDLLANCVGYGLIAPWLGASLVLGRIARGAEILSAVSVLLPLVAGAFLWTTVLDLPGDRRTGKRTWAVRWGERRTLQVAVLAAAAAVLAAFVSAPTLDGGSLLFRARLAGAVVVLAVALLLAVRPARPQALRRAIPLAVMAAAAPGLACWPSLAVILGGWLLVAYGCLRQAGLQRAQGPG